LSAEGGAVELREMALLVFDVDVINSHFIAASRHELPLMNGHILPASPLKCR
jgi:hypothetical protein